MEIVCDTCGKKFNKCKSHITTHNFCSRECRGKFDNHQITLYCTVCGKEIKRCKSQVNKTINPFCSRECYEKFLFNNGTRKGCKVSEETRKKMSEAAMGSKNHMFGKKQSEETIKKRAEKMKGHKGFWTGKKQPEELVKRRSEKIRGHVCSEKTRFKISIANSNKKRTKEQRERYSQNMATRYLHDNFIPVKHSKQGYFYSAKNNCFLFYRSSYELEAYKCLEADENVILYDRECIKIPYFYDGINRFYIPDIYIEFENGEKKLVEVKAKWAINNERNKIKFKVANDYCLLNNLTFEVWTEKELNIGLR